MHDQESRRVALFRYMVIAPLLNLAPTRGALKAEIERLAEQVWEHPLKGPTHFRFGTIEQWLYCYRRDGLDALMPTVRRDHGKSRAIDDELAEKIEALAKGRPELDGPGILDELKATVDKGKDLPSRSALYRFLRSRGLQTRRSPRRQDHRAFAFELAGDCWQCDVMYGPAMPMVEGTRRKTYLIAILDDATRLIVHAQFYFEQHLRSLKDCLKQGLKKRGLPRKFYFDQGKIFRSRMVLLLCARLAIVLIHTRPYRPQGRAKLERFFGTVRRAFLKHIDIDRLENLQHLNRLLFAWIEGKYHQKPHRGLDGETPLDRWVRLSEGIRPLPRDVNLDELFLEETTRRVKKDGTLTLKGKTFEAGPRFIGERVKVLFDPFDLRRILCQGADQERTEIFPVDIYANRHVRRNPSPEPTEPKERPDLRAMEDLADRLEKENDPESDTEQSE